MDNVNRIKIIDSPTGSGKTSYIIDYINKSDSNKKFLVITPLLDEVGRFIRSCPEKNFYEPQVKMKDNIPSKMNHLIELVSQGKNIASTHALLQGITDELITLLRNSNYTLVLDEAFQVVEQYNLYPEKTKSTSDEIDALTKEDVQWLFDEGYISTNENYMVIWNNENRTVGNKYFLLKALIQREMMYLVNNSLFLWTFPYEVFAEGIFEECYILTYMFESQFQHYYYQYFGIQYDKYHIEKINDVYNMVFTTDNKYELDFKRKAKELITVVDNEKLNKIGSFYRNIHGKVKTTDLSMKWYKNNPVLVKQLNNNLYNFFRNISYVPMENRLWTSFKGYKKKLQNQMTGKKEAVKIKEAGDELKNLLVTFLEITSRATNNYKHKTTLAYLINRYPNQFYVAFFKKRGITVDNDLYALGDIIQWIWRSAIRDGKPITLYLPSERMRIILNNFLNDTTITNFDDAEYEEE